MTEKLINEHGDGVKQVAPTLPSGKTLVQDTTDGGRSHRPGPAGTVPRKGTVR